VHAGELVEIRQPPWGLRGWLALAGGVELPEVLGSRSTDTLSGLGPAPVVSGDVLSLGPAPTTYVAEARAVPADPTGGETQLRMTLGPRDGWFTPEALRRLVRTTYEVSPDSDRVGLRLSAGDEGRLERRTDSELASEGIVLGAVQVPGDGQPLIFLADHPVTGGYPVVGVVDRDDVARCAQHRPGDQVRFRLVDGRRSD
jgi:biotin-dependent carboxylase-like uncharacterized protein